MSAPRLTLKPGRERSLLRRHPWVFSGAIGKVQGSPQSGANVEVRAADGVRMAEVRPGNRALVHHVIAFVLRTVEADRVW